VQGTPTNWNVAEILDFTLIGPQQVAATINEITHELDISAIVSDHLDGQHILQVHRKNETHSTTVGNTDPLFEALSYPLFFPFGEEGWCLRLKLPFQKYIISRMLMPERGMIYPSGDGEHFFPTNRFQLLHRLGQTYHIDQLSRIIDRRISQERVHLNTMMRGVNLIRERNIQAANVSDAMDDPAAHNDGDSDGERNVRAANASAAMDDEVDAADDGGESDEDRNISDVDDSDHDDENEEHEDQDQGRGDAKVEPEYAPGSKKTFLSDRLHGSRRHLKKLALNALAVVASEGRPDLFLTVTCNTKWPELIEALPPGKSAFDCPMVTSLVFKHRLDSLLHNLRSGIYFNGQRTVYILRVIEYQHRGLPHAHIVFKLNGMPTEADDIIDWIDQNISAMMPIEPLDCTASTFEEDQLYFQNVRDFNVHGHSIGQVNSCKANASSMCKRGFDETTVQPKSSIDPRGYPIYKRLVQDDLVVVPHHRKMIIDWNGHLNLEFCGSTFCILYLYKYLFKGSRKVKIAFAILRPLHPRDEIGHYIRGRKLSSMEAMWRSLGFQTYPASEPKVCTIKVMLEAMVEHHRGLDPPKLTSMDLYFNRPMALLRMKFQEMFEKYIVQRKPKTLQNVNGQWMCGRPLRLCFHLAMLSDVYGRQIYLVARDPSQPAISRLEQGRLGEGEKWYLRIILLNRPIRSFEDAKLVNGVRYPTFQEAALSSNFIKDGDECLCAFREAQLINIPRQMRALFTILTI